MLLIDLFSNLIEIQDNAKLLILGEGEQRDYLQKLIAERNLEGKIKLAGRVNNPFPYIKKCVAYISLSLFEGFPNSLVESMICGIPVMHSDCPTGPFEILESDIHSTIKLGPIEGKYGILLPLITHDNSEEYYKVLGQISEKWNEILCNKNMQNKMSQESMEGARKYSVENCINVYRQIIEEVTYK